MQNRILTHYDCPHMGKLCKKVQMWQRAAEHYTDINNIKRVFKNSHQMQPEFVVKYFGKLNPEQSISLLKDMLSRGPANVQVCVEIAKKYNKELGASELVKVFEQNKAIEGLYFYLGAIVNFSEDAVVHFNSMSVDSGANNKNDSADDINDDANDSNIDAHNIVNVSNEYIIWRNQIKLQVKKKVQVTIPYHPYQIIFKY